MQYDFDQTVNRRDTNCAKWGMYDNDVLPLWVADMDFVSPEPVIRALHERIDHRVFGYSMPPPELTEVVCERLDRLYNWQVTPEHILYVPGLVVGFNLACRAVGQPGDGVLMQTPVYPPFLSAPGNADQQMQVAQLTPVRDRSTLRYELDDDRFEGAITPQTRMFLLCNPHNPIGRGYSPAELTRMADVCSKHDLIICSDEIHADLLLDQTVHTPIASLSPEIADRCITLIAPSKTFNIPGLKCGMAVIQNKKLRARYNRAMQGVAEHAINTLGYAAALAAYKEGEGWLRQLLAYLSGNRNFVVSYLNEHLPAIATTVPEATYLAWLDCQQLALDPDPYRFFLEKAKVALNDGKTFGSGGEGFVRLNFGCPRSILEQGLEQMREAVAAHS